MKLLASCSNTVCRMHSSVSRHFCLSRNMLHQLAPLSGTAEVKYLTCAGSVWCQDSGHLIEPDLPLCCGLHIPVLTPFNLLVAERLNLIYTPTAPGSACVFPSVFFITIPPPTAWDRHLNWKLFCSVCLKSIRGYALLSIWREDEDTVSDTTMISITSLSLSLSLSHTHTNITYIYQGCKNPGRRNFLSWCLTSQYLQYVTY